MDRRYGDFRRWAAVLLLCLAVGACRNASREAASAPDQEVTFTREVAPILFEKCAPCHRPGQAAPFPLLSYADAQPRAAAIAAVTQTRRMPPWLPDLEPTPTFVAERRLDAGEIAALQRWAAAGAPEGDRRDLPTLPAWPERWEHGTPDMVLTLPRPYTLAPAGQGRHDVFRNIVLPVPLPRGRYVRAVEFRPGPAPVVHHAVISIDRTNASRRRDGADGQVGYDGMMTQNTQNPDGHFLGWTPGRGPITSPEGLPWRLEQGSDLVVQLHLLPGQSPVQVQPTIGLFFTDTPPLAHPMMVKLGSKAIYIPPGERAYPIEDSYVLPVDVDLLSLYPHAHYLGKEMHADALFPDGTRRTLLHIRQWSFHWQQDYRFLKPVPLPRGTRVSMRYTYDNSGAGTHTGHAPGPLRPVRYGPNSSDEMGDLWLQLLPRSPADAAIIARDVAQHEAQLNVAGAELLVRHAPDDPKELTFLGGSYAHVGRIAEAATVLEKAVRLDPGAAQAHNYLGGIRVSQQRLPEAIDHFRKAAALSPQDERMHANLGNVLTANGQPVEGARAFRKALAINPDFAAAHQNLGVFLLSQNKVGEALTHLRRAVALAPTPELLTDVAALLVQTGERDEAARLLQQALVLQPGYAPALTALRQIQTGR